MKRFLSVLWVGLALFIPTWLVMFTILHEVFIPRDNLYFSSLFSFLLALVYMRLIYGGRSHFWARELFRMYRLATFGAAAIMAILLLISISGFASTTGTGTSSLYLLFLILLFLFLVIRTYHNAKYRLSVIFALTGSFVILIHFFSTLSMMDYRRIHLEWKADHHPLTLEEIAVQNLPLDTCSEWLDTLDRHGSCGLDPELQKLESSLTTLEFQLTKDYHLAANPSSTLLNSGIRDLPGWEIYEHWNEDIFRAMDTCTGINPIHYEDYFHYPMRYLYFDLYPNGYYGHTLHFWGRLVRIQALFAAASGDEQRYTELLQGLMQASEKQFTPVDSRKNIYQFFLQRYISFAMASRQAMTAQPFNPTECEIIQDGMKWDRDHFLRYADFKCARSLDSAGKVPPGTSPLEKPLYNLLHPLYLFLYNDQHIRIIHRMNEMRVFFHQNWNPGGLFRWPEFHDAFSADLSFQEYHYVYSYTLGRDYASLLNNLLEWRLLKARNMLLVFYRSHGHLPEDPARQLIDWPLDPFTDRPLLTSRLSDHEYLLYSTGPDIRDSRGENLNVYGVQCVTCDQDLGVHVKLPEIK